MEELDAVLKEAREGGPSADELRAMHELLLRRLESGRQDLVDLPEGAPERKALEKQVRELQRQVEALAEEAAITRFVEETTVVTMRLSQLEPR